jgi:hypothetical protein
MSATFIRTLSSDELTNATISAYCKANKKYPHAAEVHTDASVWVQSTVDFAQRETKKLSLLIKAVVNERTDKLLSFLNRCAKIFLTLKLKWPEPFETAVTQCTALRVSHCNSLLNKQPDWIAILPILRNTLPCLSSAPYLALQLTNLLDAFGRTVTDDWTRMLALGDAMYYASVVETIMRHKKFATSDRHEESELDESHTTVESFFECVEKLGDPSLEKLLADAKGILITIPEALERQFGRGVLIVDLGELGLAFASEVQSYLEVLTLTMNWVLVLEVDANADGEPQLVLVDPGTSYDAVDRSDYKVSKLKSCSHITIIRCFQGHFSPSVRALVGELDQCERPTNKKLQVLVLDMHQSPSSTYGLNGYTKIEDHEKIDHAGVLNLDADQLALFCKHIRNRHHHCHISKEVPGLVCPWSTERATEELAFKLRAQVRGEGIQVISLTAPPGEKMRATELMRHLAICHASANRRDRVVYFGTCDDVSRFNNDTTFRFNTFCFVSDDCRTDFGQAIGSITNAFVVMWER